MHSKPALVQALGSKQALALAQVHSKRVLEQAQGSKQALELALAQDSKPVLALVLGSKLVRESAQDSKLALAQDSKQALAQDSKQAQVLGSKALARGSTGLYGCKACRTSRLRLGWW